MGIDVGKLELDRFGRAVLSDDELTLIEAACDVTTAGGANNVGCPNTVNASCLNRDCGGSYNGSCTNTSCGNASNGAGCVNKEAGDES